MWIQSGTQILWQCWSELEDNLTGRGTVQMEEENNINKHMCDKLLHYLMHLKDERCWKIKAQGCADGKPQRAHITKESDLSTVATNSLSVMCVFCATEERDPWPFDLYIYLFLYLCV